MTSWTKQNRWYLLACAILVPAALVIASTVGFIPYLESESGQRIPVQSFVSAEYGSATYTMLEHHSFDWTTQAGENAGLLEGTELLTVTLGVTPGGGEFTGCEFTLFDNDRERQWDPASTYDADFATAAGTEEFCSSDAVDPYRLEVFFVVPAGASRDGFLELSYFTLQPSALSFEL